MKFFFLFVALWFADGAPGASSSCDHTADTFRCVRFLKNHDGDTVTVKIPGVHPLFGDHIPVRIRGIDTPETTGKNPCEKDQARTAKRLVQNLMSRSKNIELRHVGRDKYFRVLADVWVDGQSIGSVLVKNGLAYPYEGGRKPSSINWCQKIRSNL